MEVAQTPKLFKAVQIAARPDISEYNMVFSVKVVGTEPQCSRF